MQTKTVRRSVALSRTLLEQVREVAPPEIRGNVNRMISIALEDYVARRREREFERAMAEMAVDPDIRSQCRVIEEAFSETELDGLTT